MEKCQPKNVWLFVNGMSVDGSPPFGKTLFTCILHIILSKNSVEESIFATAFDIIWSYG